MEGDTVQRDDECQKEEEAKQESDIFFCLFVSDKKEELGQEHFHNKISDPDKEVGEQVKKIFQINIITHSKACIFLYAKLHF